MLNYKDLPLPLAYAGDKKVKRFHFSEIIGRLLYTRAAVTTDKYYLTAPHIPGHY
jgi:hypothetical protein